jgi:hypothetical protein
VLQCEGCVHRFAVLVPAKAGPLLPYQRVAGAGVHLDAPLRIVHASGAAAAAVLPPRAPASAPVAMPAPSGGGSVPGSACVSRNSTPTPLGDGDEDGRKGGFKGVFKRVASHSRERTSSRNSQ